MPNFVSDGGTSSYTLGQLSAYFLKLGVTGFGGPIALVGYMRRDLVERRKWVSEADYNEGLALAQLAPGPLAAQLAIYLGFIRYRVFGAAIVGLAFVLPSFLMVVALGWAYSAYGGLHWMQAVFYGVGAAVIGIIGLSALRLTQKTIRSDRLLWILFAISALCTVITESESALLFLCSGFAALLMRAPPAGLQQAQLNCCTLALILMQTLRIDPEKETLWRIAVFFGKAGAFIFGSGLAIVPFLYSGVVKEYHWLNEAQFLDAVAVAMITPGPVVITVGFIGYLVAGLKGACLAALATFLPCFFFTVIPAPYFKRYGQRREIKAFVDGVTAAAIGAICGAVVVLGRQTLFQNGDPNWLKIGLCSLTLATLLRFKIQEPLIVLGAALLGLALYSSDPSGHSTDRESADLNPSRIEQYGASLRGN